MRSFRVTVGVLVAAGLAATGCSSSSSTAPATVGTPKPLTSSAYKQQLHVIALEENQAQQRVAAAFHAKTVTQVSGDLSDFETDQRQAAAQLATIAPPPDARAANAALAKAFTDNASAIHSLLAQLAHAKNVKQALHLIKTDPAAPRVGREIDAALKRLKRLGYTEGS